MVVKFLILSFYVLLIFLLFREAHRFSIINFKLKKVYYPVKLEDVNSYFEYMFSFKAFTKPIQPEILKSEMNTEKIRDLETKLSRHVMMVVVYSVLFILPIVAWVLINVFRN